MLLNLDENKVMWRWLRAHEDSVEVATYDGWTPTTIRFDQIVALGQLWYQEEEDWWPGLFFIVILQDQIAFIPSTAIGLEELLSALRDYWHEVLPRSRADWLIPPGMDAATRVLWPKKAKGEAIIEWIPVKEEWSNSVSKVGTLLSRLLSGKRLHPVKAVLTPLVNELVCERAAPKEEGVEGVR